MISLPSFKTEIKGRDGVRRPVFTVDELTGCWISTGKDQGDGYAMVNSKPGHRVFYVAAFGILEAELEIHHLCMNTRCIRPTHLLPLTPQDHRWIHVVLRAWARLLSCLRPETVLNP